jgi:hypothetical protein
MRDRARQKALAEAKSHRASAEELRDAGKRVKELEQELLTTIQIQPETTHGEERRQRYSRLLRVRAMRDEFTRARPLETEHPNGLLLAVIMGVAAFMLCGFCAGGTLVGVQVLTYKPSPQATGTAFWQDVEQENYGLLISDDVLSPTLRVQYSDPSQFATTAKVADGYYGPVTSFSLVAQGGDMTQSATLTYTVTRGTSKVYKATLSLVPFSGNWGVSDLGSSLAPWEKPLDPSLNSGLPPPPTPSPSPTQIPTATPVLGASSGRPPAGPPGRVA